MSEEAYETATQELPSGALGDKYTEQEPLMKEEAGSSLWRAGKVEPYRPSNAHRQSWSLQFPVPCRIGEWEEEALACCACDEVFHMSMLNRKVRGELRW